MSEHKSRPLAEQFDRPWTMAELSAALRPGPLRSYRLDGSEPLPPELAHLASDAPYVQCDKCGRHEYDRGYASGAEPCQFPQPDHSRCDGTLQGSGNA